MMPVLEPSGQYEDSGRRATARFADRDLGRLPLSRRRFLGDRFLCLLLARDRHQHFLPAGRCLPRLLGNLFGALVSAAVVAARAEPDGFTLLMTLSSLAVLPEVDRLFARPRAVRSLIWTRLNFLNSSRTTARG
jgi:hypothetical protein